MFLAFVVSLNLWQVLDILPDFVKIGVFHIFFWVQFFKVKGSFS